MDSHYIQLEVLKQLSLKRSVSFTDLNTKNIDSDLFAYHLKKLQQNGLITKVEGQYILTSKGKDFSNSLDIDSATIKFEKQAFISVLVHVFQGESFESPMVVHTRLKEPFYGFKGMITGRVKYGEGIFDAAKREVMEETSLEGEVNFHGVAHFTNTQRKEVVEDKVLFVFSMLKAKGNLKKKDQGFKNEWMTISEYLREDLIYEGEADILEMILGKRKSCFLEQRFSPKFF